MGRIHKENYEKIILGKLMINDMLNSEYQREKKKKFFQKEYRTLKEAVGITKNNRYMWEVRSMREENYKIIMKREN